MNAEFLCRCGHAYKEHHLTVCDGDECCVVCYNRYGEKKANHEFTGDNLKSLELFSR